MAKRLSAISSALLIALCPCALAESVAGWSIASEGLWRLPEDADYSFSKGSPAKMVRADRAIPNRQASFTRRSGLVGTYTFKVGCVFQSKTPAFELSVQPLDIRISDQFNGYAFARFLVDKGQEYSLRGEYLPPARLVFAPLSRTQDRSISDIFLQLREGAKLSVALLEGSDNPPRVYEVPLAGFMDLSDQVAKDCERLNRGAGVRTSFVPDYVTSEPPGMAPKDWSLKPKAPNDGLTPVKPDNPPGTTEQTPGPAQPDVQYFEPGGGPASIGPDGKPITQGAQQDPNASLGTASGPMAIGPDGKPVSQAAGQSTAQGQPQSASSAQQGQNASAAQQGQNAT
ncbi:MAG: hypothetical protein ACI4NA_00125, partial [Succinivibrio sp.]